MSSTVTPATGLSEKRSSSYHRQAAHAYPDDSSDDGFYDYLSEEDDDYDEIAYLRHKLNRLELDNKFLSQQNSHLGKELSFNRYTIIAMRNIVSQKESTLQAASQELDKAHFRIRMLESMLMGRQTPSYDNTVFHNPSGMDQSLRSKAIHALKQNHRSNMSATLEDESVIDDDDSDYDDEADEEDNEPILDRNNIQSLLPIRSPSPSDELVDELLTDSRRSSQDISASGSDSDESSIHQSSPPSRPSDDKVNIWNKNEDLFADDYVDLVGWHDDQDTTTDTALKSVKQTSFISNRSIVATSL